ncbi:MAG: zinc-finger domain-containing protein [Limnohabitans sp.]
MHSTHRATLGWHVRACFCVTICSIGDKLKKRIDVPLVWHAMTS